MKIFTITKEHTNEKNEYIGPDLSDYDGHIEADEGLGCVRFKSLKASGYILFKAGSGIKAGDGIDAGRGIEAGWGIDAGRGIEAGDGIDAGRGIKAGDGIDAGWGIEAGEGIEAGNGIEAGWSIKAGLSIKCTILSSKLRIFAGLCIWREPQPEEMVIECNRLEKGTVCFGKLNEKDKI